MRIPVVLLSYAVLSLAACGSDDPPPGSEAQVHGVGAACSVDTDCTEAGQVCLPFKGGYCGVQGCQTSTACPQGSACVAHTDGSKYCFLLCTDKPQCNLYRGVDVAANCSANVTFVDAPAGNKACVPPS